MAYCLVAQFSNNKSKIHVRYCKNFIDVYFGAGGGGGLCWGLLGNMGMGVGDCGSGVQRYKSR